MNKKAINDHVELYVGSIEKKELTKSGTFRYQVAYRNSRGRVNRFWTIMPGETGYNVGDSVPVISKFGLRHSIIGGSENLPPKMSKDTNICQLISVGSLSFCCGFAICAIIAHQKSKKRSVNN